MRHESVTTTVTFATSKREIKRRDFKARTDMPKFVSCANKRTSKCEGMSGAPGFSSLVCGRHSVCLGSYSVVIAVDVCKNCSG